MVIPCRVGYMRNPGVPHQGPALPPKNLTEVVEAAVAITTAFTVVPSGDCPDGTLLF